MAAVANHDLWKDCMRREEKIRNKCKKKSDESRCKVSAQLMPVYERTTTTIKKEKFYALPEQQTVYTCHPRNAPTLTKDTPPVTCIPVEVKHDHRPALHLVNSCPQMKTCQLPIFHKSSSAANMVNKSEGIVKMKHACAEKVVVENEYLHPAVLKKRYPTVRKTEEVKLQPHLIATIGDQGIPFRERLWVVRE
ncbi:hypothetical protein AVEN_228372-1 [Araneus ventricosus]|uniref:Uncharacterized protein n=1 Tax=Araneus ventricosus TaxID=182803 RepID=A0A4Y2LIR0_ARAVE|nr:hypothetical protein AVEN_228372-1 [Araneus ventricosus]